MLGIDLNFDDRKGLNIVAVGGGTGLATLLSGLKEYVGSPTQPDAIIKDLSAIVAVTDDGGSSGRLRDELKMLPPGDIRNCMVALSEDSYLLSQLFQYRFEGDGDLSGHSFGNLFLAALSEVTGDFAEAVRLSSEILASKGHIFPATMADVRVAARLVNGEIIRGETNVSRVGPRIERLFLEPADCSPLPSAIGAIENADVITVGPGSLFTSLIPPVLVNGVADLIAGSPAVKIFICNLMTQPGETEGLSAHRHLEIFRKYAPELEFDHILVNNRPISKEQQQRYLEDGAEQIGVRDSMDSVTIERTKVVHCDLLDTGEKVRHDPAKLAKAVLSCVPERKRKESAGN